TSRRGRGFGSGAIERRMPALLGEVQATANELFEPNGFSAEPKNHEVYSQRRARANTSVPTAISTKPKILEIFINTSVKKQHNSV
ncbi:MAG: hypothetical protein FWE68_00935, partial [Defluviitaleaceae bacterium]|nr:hypothetical protein [Defluviitaleaceae bacterium]